MACTRVRAETIWRRQWELGESRLGHAVLPLSMGLFERLRERCNHHARIVVEERPLAGTTLLNQRTRLLASAPRA
jgi:hypothetical protein